MKIHELLDEGLGSAFKTGYETGKNVNLFNWAKKRLGFKPSKKDGGKKPIASSLTQSEIERLYEKEKRYAEKQKDPEEKERLLDLAKYNKQLGLQSLRNTTSESYIREHSTDILDNLTVVLRDLIRNADNQSLPSKMTYLALIKLLEPLIGDVNIDQQSLKQLIGDYPNLSKYVKTTDKTGVVLATKVKYKPKTKPTKKTPKTKKNKSGVRGAASRGAKYLSKSRNNP